MNLSNLMPEVDERNSHRLQLAKVELVGGSREVLFNPGYNIILGDITTGKTTLVRLIRAMLGTVPKDLPPEVGYVQAIAGSTALGRQSWRIYRRNTTTRDALVEVSEELPDSDREAISLRLPVSGRGRTYSDFLLEELNLPVVKVPQARTDPTSALTPVTMTDWLGYCIVTGDELDTEVFGHRRDWRNLKRRWVFELAYGYYDPQLAHLNSQLRSIELRLSSIDQESAVRQKFLAETPFGDIRAIDAQISQYLDELASLELRRKNIAGGSLQVPGVESVRTELLEARARQSEIAVQGNRLAAQIHDLRDLRRQLSSQSARLTRAIVADEWLVDFDFVVCPRCGNDVDPTRTDPDHCYLCFQLPRPAPSRLQMQSEQDRISAQIAETDQVISDREVTLNGLTEKRTALEEAIAALSLELDARTASFISDHAADLEGLAARRAHVEVEIRRLREYRELLERHQHHLQGRAELEAQKDELLAQIHGMELGRVDAEGNVAALEERILEYLKQLHIPDLGQDLSVRINRTTYLPEIAGRSFDELSSQGLKTLVNVAHALAHHTVAIDRGLPMPGFLVLDGLSANAGHDGFDLDRVRDVYRLLARVSGEYKEALQVIAVDNELSRNILSEFVSYVVLTLTQEDRLIRIPASSVRS